MVLPRYELKTEKSRLFFEFMSEGHQVEILKIIKFCRTDFSGMYNLAFGDKGLTNGEIDDTSVSNNGDARKILATVVDAVCIFSDKYPNAWIYAIGSTQLRTRLYRMGIAKSLLDINKDFEIYGMIGNGWYPFVKNEAYEAFLIKKND
jgi:hypothetical protein